MFEDYKDIVTVDEVAEMLNIGKSSAYTLIRTKQVNHWRIGNKIKIPKRFVMEYIDRMCYNNPVVASLPS